MLSFVPFPASAHPWDLTLGLGFHVRQPVFNYFFDCAYSSLHLGILILTIVLKLLIPLK